jgi:hypothetical protein
MFQHDEADYNHSVSPRGLVKKREKVRKEDGEGFLNL